ncbi:diguanylate cyclase [Shewanella sp. AS16]|uniref:LapD/MoxY N-terminal periplasmic domain-containing protein n=1 Tax=Shewanella sp. AS16 TaxID=2907625 RepID=UPI001F21C302|nr:LapD/MoxY N-terminal periplasmic domain-containing protein [Shewanella sp. AS16]MCE9686986.1 diguanylate cyclase [Shewanella sp. AS16]
MKKWHGLPLTTQLYSLVVCLALLTFSASLYNNITSMQDYLEAQLASHAQGAAHSLGLSISPYLDEDNLVTAETMVDAIFNSGYYQQISFVDPDNKLLFSRQHTGNSFQVPDWFSRWFPLNPPVMVSEVNAGWRPAGSLRVQSHPGMAYDTLWQQSMKVAAISLIQLLFSLLVAYLILKSVIGSLKKLEQQTQSVPHKQFELDEAVFSTSEIRALAQALNRMLTKLRQSFEDQSLQTDKLSMEVYLDSLTGLPNRRALLQQFANMQLEGDSSGKALYLGLVSLPSLTEINSSKGYGSGDAYVTKAAMTLQAQMLDIGYLRIYRVSGSEFAILTRLSASVAKILDNKLSIVFNAARGTGYPNGFAQHVMLKVNPNESFSACIKRLDTLIAPDSGFSIHHGLRSVK